MQLYNTLSRRIESVVPLASPKVTIYSCGPTVYDYPHIGNWFTFIRYDLLVRTLELSGYNPLWVMNITDVGHLVSDADDGQDKLEKGASRDGKTAWDVAEFYSNYFVKALQRLDFRQPDFLPKATEHIAEQLALIEVLEAKGYTYKTSDGVYFDTAKFPAYADFAHLDIDEQQAGARVEFNPEKRNITDFALWKFSPHGNGQRRDMEWPSPLEGSLQTTSSSLGFPGWHIECSAMAMKYLGETIDIHAGGIDHIPVHHSNEIAQSQSATGKPLATIWMHTNHISIESQKISKSLGNGLTLEDIETRGHNLVAFRLHVLESHYRSQSKFSWDSLAAAGNRLKSLQAVADLRWQDIPGEVTDEYIELLSETLPAKISLALQNDLNTPQVLSILSEAEGEIISSYCSSYRDGFEQFIHTYIGDALGINLLASADIIDAQKLMISERQTARESKNWAESDALRAQLTQQGIGVRDMPHGPIWYRL